jgi:hypothetical protein
MPADTAKWETWSPEAHNARIAELAAEIAAAVPSGFTPDVYQRAAGAVVTYGDVETAMRDPGLDAWAHAALASFARQADAAAARIRAVA